MQLLVEVPSRLPDAALCTPQQFLQAAKRAMDIKLFDMRRWSSGMAALLIEMARIQLLAELNRFDLGQDEHAQDIFSA